jgi:coproporphyrinogen III oxidase
MSLDPLFEPAADHFLDLQTRIVAALEALDGHATFHRDEWTRDESEVPDGPSLRGWGRTCALEGGAVLEKAGVAFSKVRGRLAQGHAEAMPGDGLDFQATGVSLVLHPRNPHVPIVHLNYRRLARGATAWFGGGADLTPCYLDPQDVQHFHETHRRVCEQHARVADWPTLHRDCDAYFYLPHRGERRGVGGLFFDHMAANPEEMFAFVKAVGDAFLPAWLPIAQRHRDDPYGDRERQWQLVRRGRYVEFNLVHDRGTVFGLRTGGRIESILMSMPPLAAWGYDLQPEPGSPEAVMQQALVRPA